MPSPIINKSGEIPFTASRNGTTFDAELLRVSGIFDEGQYTRQVGVEAGAEPVAHYLRTGWRNGLEPNSRFPGKLLWPYFASIGLDGPPAVTWLMLRSAGWPLPADQYELNALTQTLRTCGLFNEGFYLDQLPPSITHLDPAIHYIIAGEQMGFAPSADFDPAYYRRRYPDIGLAGINCLQHYIAYGRGEGRNARPFTANATAGKATAADRPNVLLVIHEASRTGAPVLAWNVAKHLCRRYNLHIICLGKGLLLSEFQNVSAWLYGPFPATIARSVNELEFSLRDILAERKFEYAIVNSIESRFVLEACARRFIPTLLLVHEFASYVYPYSSMRDGLDWATHIVFPAKTVAQSAETAHPAVCNQAVHILPQGVSMVPEAEETENVDFALELNNIEQKKKNGCSIVVGAGAVQIRKGVDLFLRIAAATAALRPVGDIHFVWVGQDYRPKEDMSYSVYLSEQIQRSGMQDHVTFLGEAPGLQSIYELSDAFVLSSRLDPLPNVSIDAAVHGLPIVCFKNASGMAELLLQDPDTAKCVVEHLDTEAAARVICKLVDDKELRERTSEAIKRFAGRTFDMAGYVEKLDVIGRGSSSAMEQRRADAEVIAADSTFDQNFFLGPAAILESRCDSILRYLVGRAAMGAPEQPAKDHPRRPCPGFHPQIYSTDRSLDRAVDPLADYIRGGKQPGRWQARVIRPEDSDNHLEPAARLHVALHAHLYYPEMVHSLLFRLNMNRSRCDLLISTNEASKVERLRQATKRYENGCVDIRVLPNKGRDLGPLLSGFGCDLHKYDVVGHVHSKRSEKVFHWDVEIGDTWREFIWQHLIGGRYRVMDKIIAAFENDQALGLIFPSDPYLVGWDKNRIYGETLAARMGWQGPLPDSFDFPLGTMFWIRTKALQPLLDLRLGWDDYPEEPVPYDGTLLHALERMMPFAAQIAGYSFAVTHLSGVDWSSAASNAATQG